MFLSVLFHNEKKIRGGELHEHLQRVRYTRDI